jgi:transcriptional regulator with XRE-family HTH domain
MNNLHTKLGIIIAQRRKEQYLSQENFAEKAGIHRTYVSQIERGLKSPTLYTLANIAKAFDITLTKLISEISGDE